MMLAVVDAGAEILFSCSPIEYNFKIDLNKDSAVNELESLQGIVITEVDYSDEFSNVATISSAQFIQSNAFGDVIADKRVEFDPLNIEQLQGGLPDIEFTVPSISSTLIPAVFLPDQLAFVPVSNTLMLTGVTVVGEEVQTQFGWQYDNSHPNEIFKQVAYQVGWFKIVSTAQLLPHTTTLPHLINNNIVLLIFTFFHKSFLLCGNRLLLDPQQQRFVQGPILSRPLTPCHTAARCPSPPPPPKLPKERRPRRQRLANVFEDSLESSNCWMNEYMSMLLESLMLVGRDMNRYEETRKIE